MKTLARPRDKDEILRRLRTVRPDSVGRWGRMSAHQMVCHLTDALRMVLGQRLVSRVHRPTLGKVLKWVALYLPIRWPAGIPTRPELDQEMGGTPPADFEADVELLEDLIELITVETRHVEGQVHPLFGRMSDGAWLRWAYLHIDHHLRQFGA